VQIIGHTFRPFTRKMRIVALERGIPIEFIEDMPLAETTAVPKYNPLGKVPVLVRDDGSALIDSPLIAAWLDAHGEGEGLIPADQTQQICVQQWEAVVDGVAEAAVLMRSETLRPEGERSRAWAQRQETKVVCGLRWMNERLGGKYCVGSIVNELANSGKQL
jgi:glutathione S-transferase